MAPLPAVVLMQPTLIAKPFHREGWVYEEKVDSWRMVAYKQDFSIRLISRQGRDHAGRFPGIVAALKNLPDNPLVLDGKVAIYDRQLISRFEWLRHHAAPEVATPPLFMVFDCLSARGKDANSRSTCGATWWRTYWTIKTWCSRAAPRRRRPEGVGAGARA